MIVSLNLDPEDVRRLDEMAGPRQRSEFVRGLIARAHRNHNRQRKLDPRPPQAGPTPRKKAA